MEKLLILDFCKSEVHIYDVDSDVNIDEKYIEDMGFRTDECSWMFGEDIEIVYHKERLK